MSSQGLGISGTAANNSDPDDFNPLMFLADAAIQDLVHDASPQDIPMQETIAHPANTQDSVTQNANSRNVNNQDAIDPDPVRQGDGESGGSENLTRHVAMADQLLSTLTGQSPMTTGISLSISMESDDEDGEDDGENTIRDELDAKGKGKSNSRKKKSAEERLATIVDSMVEQKAEEEKQVLSEMRRDETINRIAETSGTGSTSLDEIEATGILPENAILVASLLGQGLEEMEVEDLIVFGSKRRLLRQAAGAGTVFGRKNFSLISELSNYLELFMELAKHLGINDLIALYAISKDFNETLNGHLSHILKACAAYQAPESSRIYVFTLYRSLCIPDPVGRPDATNPAVARMVPSLRWLRMIIHREKCVRDILACMAREGHRMPKTMSLSVKKMWLTMDIPTSARRVQLMHNESYWTDNDLYNIQLLIIKLDMRFNDPIEGPGDDGLRKLMLGQRGLTPLCHLLKRTRFVDNLEVLEACVRYSYWSMPQHRHLPILGVPANEVGRGHLEGWGVGKVHLYRLDELVMRESCRRNMNLKSHLYTMMVWGYVDAATGENIMPTEEERYMSDDDEKRKKKKKKAIVHGGGVNKKGKDAVNETNAHSSEKREEDGEGDMYMAG